MNRMEARKGGGVLQAPFEQTLAVRCILSFAKYSLDPKP